MSMEKKNWTVEQAQELAGLLEASQRSRVLNKRQLIGEALYPAITAKLKNGWSYQTVCEELSLLGIAVTPNTLRTYLKTATKPRRGVTRDKAVRPREEPAEPSHHLPPAHSPPPLRPWGRDTESVSDDTPI